MIAFMRGILQSKRAQGALAAIVTFVGVGTITSIWKNPFFTRMTVAGNWEMPSLILLSVLTGLFIVVRRPICRGRQAGLGGIVSFVGIACPICNKILVFLFGGNLLLQWFDPIRPFVTAFGIILLLVTITIELRNRQGEPD